MKKILLILVVLTFMAACSSGPSGGKTLVKIGGDKITEGDLNFLGEINPRLKAQLNNPIAKKQLLDKLVEQEILYREALKRGLHRNSDTKTKIEIYRKVIIAQSALEDEINKQAEKYYNDNPNEFKKLQLSQILIRYATPEDIKRRKKAKRKAKSEPAWMERNQKQALALANKIKKKLDGGASFADLAKEYSDDMLSKNRGGDLGLASKNEQRLTARGYAPLLDKAYTMEVGQIAGPIKTDKGYSIITLTRGLEVEPYEMVEDRLKMKVRVKTKSELVAKLKEEEKVEYVNNGKTVEQKQIIKEKLDTILKQPKGAQNKNAKPALKLKSEKPVKKQAAKKTN